MVRVRVNVNVSVSVRVLGFVFWVLVLGFKFGLEFKVEGLGFLVYGSGFRV